MLDGNISFVVVFKLIFTVRTVEVESHTPNVYQKLCIFLTSGQVKMFLFPMALTQNMTKYIS